MILIDAFPTQMWVEPLGWTLLHSLWQGAVITVVTWMVLRGYGVRLRSQTRYVLCCSALGLSVAAPILTFVSFSLSPDRGAMVTPASAATSVLGVVSPITSASRSSGGAVLVLPWVVLAWMIGVFARALWITSAWLAVRRLARSALPSRVEEKAKRRQCRQAMVPLP